MTPCCLHRLSCVSVGAVVGLLLSATAARAQQFDFKPPSETEALSAAAKASPELVQGLATELGSTPEQAAGVAGLLLGVAKSLLTPEAFAPVSKAVPGIDALLAVVPQGAVGTSGQFTAQPGLVPSPGFASSSPGFASSSTSTPATSASQLDGMLSAFPKIGITPDMLVKALPFLSGYLKKMGAGGVGSLLEGLLGKGK